MVKIIEQKHWWSLSILEKWETANPNWRPKKWISLVNKQLREQGYDPAKKKDIEETYLQMLQLTETELKKLFLDPKQPMLIKILASNMSNTSKNFDVVEKMLDRWIGKSIQTVQAAVMVKQVDNPLEDRLKELWLY